MNQLWNKILFKKKKVFLTSKPKFCQNFLSLCEWTMEFPCEFKENNYIPLILVFDESTFQMLCFTLIVLCLPKDYI